MRAAGGVINVTIVIVGGGKVGYYLVKALAPEKHRLVLLEADSDHCNKIADELDRLGVELICGDGTQLNILRDADIGHADILIAVTGYDQDNLVACQLAKQYFGVPRTIARVNNPKNIEVFKRLGVDSVVSSTAHIADMISQEVDWTGVNQMLEKKVGDVRIRDLLVDKSSVANGKTLTELTLPGGTILITVIRDQAAFIPNGQTRIQEGDRVIALSREEEAQRLGAFFSGDAKGREQNG
jgi:trk system potassium uptake protein